MTDELRCGHGLKAGRPGRWWHDLNGPRAGLCEQPPTELDTARALLVAAGWLVHKPGDLSTPGVPDSAGEIRGRVEALRSAGNVQPMSDPYRNSKGGAAPAAAPVDVPALPEGWMHFGTHAALDSCPALTFTDEVGEDGLPLGERCWPSAPAVDVPTEALITDGPHHWHYDRPYAGAASPGFDHSKCVPVDRRAAASAPSVPGLRAQAESACEYLDIESDGEPVAALVGEVTALRKALAVVRSFATPGTDSAPSERLRICVVCFRNFTDVEGAVWGPDGTEYSLCHPAMSSGPTCYSQYSSRVAETVRSAGLASPTSDKETDE